MFDRKKFSGKRHYESLPKYQNIYKIWLWNQDKQCYFPPEKGSIYQARRWEIDEHGEKKRKGREFDTLDGALSYRDKVEIAQPMRAVESEEKFGPTVGEMIEAYRKAHYPKIAESTAAQLDKIFRLYFDYLKPFRIKKIEPETVSKWLSVLKSQITKKAIRQSFKKELQVLNQLIEHYCERLSNSENFLSPIRRYHRQEEMIVKRVPKRRKDIPAGDFWKFVHVLEGSKYGDVMATIAVLQFYSALRISEVTAVRWEDVRWDFKERWNSEICFCQRVTYFHMNHKKDKINPGLKAGDFKILPMQPEVYQHLHQLWQKSAEKRGLVFIDPDTGGFFRYSKIQRAYNHAFEKAGLPYSATHPMRHGGGSDMLNATGGDITATQQLTDHASLEQLEVYAKRNKYALRDAVRGRWKMAITQESLTTKNN